MDCVRSISQRQALTRAWLRNFKNDASTSSEEFELIDSDECLSENGVVSLVDDERDDSFALVTKISNEVFVLPGEIKPRRKSEIPDYEVAYWEKLQFDLKSYDDRETPFTDEEWCRFDFDTLLEEQHEFLFGAVQRKDASEYEMAGRTIDHTFGDIRSPRKARDRRHKQAEKYWGFRVVNYNQIHKPHWGSRNSRGHATFCIDPRPEAQVFIMTAEELYRQAQMWPRPPKLHHRHVDKSRDPLDRQRNKYSRRFEIDVDPEVPHLEIQYGEGNTD